MKEIAGYQLVEKLFRINNMLHTVVIWQSGFYRLSELLYLFQSKYALKHAEIISWKQDQIVENLNKLYPNRTFLENSPKLKEIGGAKLLMLLVEDGESKDKSNIADFKKSFRLLSNQNIFHISDTDEDGYINYHALTNHSLQTYKKFNNSKIVKCIQSSSQKSDIEIVRIPQKSFSNFDDVFKILNKYTRYAILRNWEVLSQNMLIKNHEDIDLIVSDYFKTISLLSASQVHSEKGRVKHLVAIGDQVISFDIRFIGDNYYDKKWQENMISTRVKEENIFTLNNQNYFYSLLYHALIHKGLISNDYQKKLLEIQKSDSQIVADISTIKLAKKSLNHFLNLKSYKQVTPDDPSVTIKNSSRSLAKNIYGKSAFIRRLASRKRTIDLTNIKQLSPYLDSSVAKIVKLNVFSTHKYIIKQADKNHIFLLKNEYHLLRSVEKYNFSPKPIRLINNTDQGFLIIQKIDAKDIASRNTLSPSKLNSLIWQINDMLSKLAKQKIIHHDIRPHNLLIDKQNKLWLVDYAFSYDMSKPLKGSNNIEKFILSTNRNKLGGEWYDHSLPIEIRDANAVKKIISHYKHDPIKKITSLPHHYKLRLKRYAHYK